MSGLDPTALRRSDVEFKEVAFQAQKLFSKLLEARLMHQDASEGSHKFSKHRSYIFRSLAAYLLEASTPSQGEILFDQTDVTRGSDLVVSFQEYDRELGIILYYATHDGDAAHG